MPWCWREVRCGDVPECSTTRKTTGAVDSNNPREAATLTASGTRSSKPSRQKAVSFQTPAVAIPDIKVGSSDNRNVELCQVLKKKEFGQCIGIIGHDNETFHIHSPKTEKQDVSRGCVTLRHMLSPDFEVYISRHRRYSIALLVASSFGQLKSSPWLRNNLCKDDIVFFPSEDDKTQGRYGEPFLQRDFPDNFDHLAGPLSCGEDYNFYSLGILLLELCFGSRLEDHALRKKYPTTSDPVSEHAFDVMAALKWSSRVSGEAGDGYATAVKWCFMSATDTGNNWRSEFISNVVEPLEMCLKHFQAVAAIQ